MAWPNLTAALSVGFLLTQGLTRDPVCIGVKSIRVSLRPAGGSEELIGLGPSSKPATVTAIRVNRPKRPRRLSPVGGRNRRRRRQVTGALWRHGNRRRPVPVAAPDDDQDAGQSHNKQHKGKSCHGDILAVSCPKHQAKRGIAYGGRPLWQRSPRSSPSRGKPGTWRRRAGGLDET